MWQTEYLDLRIYEGASAFYIEYIPTGEEACMGDGVDMYSDDSGSIMVGTEEFYTLLSEDLEARYDEYLEAYFPEKEDE